MATDSKPSSIPPLGDPGDPQNKAKLDDSELSDELPKALQKVDLDLDDAPFLEDEKEEAAPAPPSAETAPPEPETVRPWWKKPPALIGGGVLLVVILALLAWLLVFRKPPPPPPAAEEAPAVEEPPAEMPAEEPKKPEVEISVPFEPFLVETTDPKGRTHFLTIRFSLSTKSPGSEAEVKRGRIVLRDAVYYYLKNKDLAFLSDTRNADTLKKDLLSVINQFLGDEQIDTLLIEEYLVK